MNFYLRNIGGIMKTFIQIQDELIARFMKIKGGIHPQTRAAGWKFFQREMTALGFTGVQISHAYGDAQDMAYLFKLCNGELN